MGQPRKASCHRGPNLPKHLPAGPSEPEMRATWLVSKNCLGIASHANYTSFVKKVCQVRLASMNFFQFLHLYMGLSRSWLTFCENPQVLAYNISPPSKSKSMLPVTVTVGRLAANQLPRAKPGAIIEKHNPAATPTKNTKQKTLSINTVPDPRCKRVDIFDRRWNNLRRQVCFWSDQPAYTCKKQQKQNHTIQRQGS